MRKFLLIPVVAALVALASTSLVNAHSHPIRFDPAPGSIQTTAPEEVTGWFTSDLRRAEETFIHVFDPDGNEVQTGEVELSSDRRQMTTALQPGLEEGRYVVYWSGFDDADGAVHGGCYAFFIGQAAADEAIANGDRLDAGAECPFEESDHSHGDDADPSAASIEISIPEVVEGDSATLEIIPTNFTARAPDGNTVDPAFGHYHIYLDKVPVELITGDHTHDEGDDHGSTGDHASNDDDSSHNPGGLVENPLMWVENSYTFTNLEPGYHTVVVALSYDDHSYFDPPVFASQTFRVEGSGSGTGGDDGGIPVWALALGIVGGVVAGGVGMKLVGSRA